MKNKKQRLLSGTLSIALAAAAAAVVLAANLLLGALPAGRGAVDVTDEKLYSIGDVTRGVLSALEEDVDLYVLTEAGQEDEAVIKLTEAYDACSDRLHVRLVDIVENPAFVKQYTEEPLPANSVLAVCGDKAAAASYSRFYTYDENSYLYDRPSAWDAEGQITTAIVRASMDTGRTVCYTTGHEEQALGTDMLDVLEKAGIEAVPVNLLSEQIPSDCSALLIFAPIRDFTEEEVNRVRSYLEHGGHMLLVTIPEAITGTATPRLGRIMEDWGVTRKGGYVMESDPSRYVQAPYILLPTLGTAEVTAGLENRNLICALAEGLEAAHDDEEELPYTVQVLLSTGEGAYMKTEVRDTVEQSDGDEVGSFVLGVAVEQTFSVNDPGSADLELDEEELRAAGAEGAGAGPEKGEERAVRIVYVSTPCLFSAEALSSLIQQQTALPEGNKALFANTMAYLTDQELAVSVPVRSLGVPQTLVDTGTQQLLGNICMFLLPALVLSAGFAVFMRRRRR